MPRSSRLWNFSVLTGGLLMSVLPALAAPANDAFVTAGVLPAALPVTVAGSNVEASNEAGEPRPELSARTVWWSWTPTSAGWVRITTRGTDIDTVLAAYTGSSLGGLARQAFNDDAGAGEGEVGPSELVFRANPGETYHLQVGGYAGWESAPPFHPNSPRPFRSSMRVSSTPILPNWPRSQSPRPPWMSPWRHRRSP